MASRELPLVFRVQSKTHAPRKCAKLPSFRFVSSASFQLT
jgi:hypothetical protein